MSRSCLDHEPEAYRYIPGSSWLRVVLAAVLCFGSIGKAKSTVAADYWTGASNLYWNTPGNWSLAAVPNSGQTAIFDSGTSTAWAANIVLRATSGTAAGIRFIGSTGYQLNPDHSAGAVTLTLANGEVWNQATSGTQTIAIPLVLGANGTFTVDSTGSNLVISDTLREEGSGRTLTKSGPGMLAMNGGNSYTGGTIIEAGTIVVGPGGYLTGDVAVAAGATLAFNRSSKFTYEGIISGSGSLTKTASSILTLTGSNSYTGLTTVSSGAIAISGATGSIAGDVIVGSGASLTFSRTSNLTYGGAVSGSGSLIQAGASTLTFTGSNAYTGGTTISSGTLQIGNGGTNGSIGGNVTNNATLTFNRSDALTHSGTIAGTGSVTKLGAGRLTLTGPNTYSGGTNVHAGTLVLGDADAIGTSGTISFGGGTLQFSASNTTDYSSRFSSAASQAYKLDTSGQNVTLGTGLASAGGTLTKLGAGTLTLTGSHGYTGPTTVQAGTLALDGTLSSSAVTVQAGGTLQGNAFLGSSLSVSGTLSPGNSPGTVTAGSLSLQAGSTTLMEIAGGGTAGTDYDTIVVTGSSGPTYGGTLAISFSSSSPFADGTRFHLFQFGGAATGDLSAITLAGSGPYAALAFSLNPDGSWYSTDTAAHQYLTFSPVTGDLVVVPEPSTWVAAASGIALAASLARRRRA